MTEIKEIKKNKEDEKDEDEEGLEQLLEDDSPRIQQPQEQLDTNNLILHSDESAPEQEAQQPELEEKLEDAPQVKSDEENPYEQETKYEQDFDYQEDNFYEQQVDEKTGEVQVRTFTNPTITELHMPSTQIEHRRQVGMVQDRNLQRQESPDEARLHKYESKIKRAKSADEISNPFESDNMEKYKPI